jgi:hypothetical protein
MNQQPARGRIVGVRLEEGRGPGAHRPVGEELQAPDPQPVVTEAAAYAGITKPIDPVILN